VSYAIYVNETDVGPMASIHGWMEFCDWAYTLDLDDYGEIVYLTEHLYSGELSVLRKQLKAILKKDPPKRDLSVLVRRLITASKQLGGEPEEESLLWITDGVNGMIHDMIPADDPNHPDPDANDEESSGNAE
jgi:hypothetical protein